jgi:hypothetical protein
MNTLLLVVLASVPVAQRSDALVPAFIESVLAGESAMAIQLVSPEALAIIDSLIAEDPGAITDVCSVFGLASFVPAELTDASSFLEDVLSSPSIPAMIFFSNPTSGEPFTTSGKTYVPVVWGIPGMRDTLFVEASRDDDLGWLIRDFFTWDPRGAGTGAGRGGRT